MSKNTRNRILLTAIAALLLVAVAVGGTMAYLQATSGTVENTFTPSGLSIKLEEHDYDPDTNTVGTAIVSENKNYKVVPGVNMPKDPFITFTSDVDCYVFVKVTEANWDIEGLDYAMNGAWQSVDGYENVYYQVFNDVTTDKTYTDQKLEVLLNNQITVNADIDLDDMATIKTKAPKLTFDAYIIQYAGFKNDVPGAYKQAAGITQ